MINKVLVVLLLMTVFSCKRKAYVEHKLKFVKVADNCAEQQTYFRLNSNFGGERYEFEKCLADNFSEDKLVSVRKGDTVLVNFPKPVDGQKTVVYHITLDIDSYPQYGFLTIDDDTYTISTNKK